MRRTTRKAAVDSLAADAPPTPSPPSLPELMARLEARLAFAREKAAFHSEQEALHGAARETHAADVARLEASLAAVREALAIVSGPGGPPPPPAPSARSLAEAGFGTPRRPRVVKLVVHALESRPSGEPVSASELAAILERQVGGLLKRPISARQVSNVLQRWAARGELKIVRPGKPHQEALYWWGLPAEGPA